MANEFWKLPDVDLVLQVTHTFTTIAEDPDSFGLSEAQVEELIMLGTQLDECVVSSREALANYHASIAMKDAVRAELMRALGFAVKRIYGVASLTDAELSHAGLAERPEFHRSRNPHPATTLVAVLIGPESVKLQWNRNGNDSRVIYRIEVKEGSQPWRLLDVVTSTKFVHDNVVPGDLLVYRVRTQRGSNQLSAYSNEAAIWTTLSARAA